LLALWYLSAVDSILCGDKPVLDIMPYLIKIHVGSLNGIRTNAVMALHLGCIETRLQKMTYLYSLNQK